MYKDITGKKFGRLVVVGLSIIDKKRDYRVYWNCLCECGKKVVVRGDILRSYRTRSCGCLLKSKVKYGAESYLYKHGKTGTKIYIAWKQIQSRCYNKKDSAYHNYGERGIKCEWETFEEFYKDMRDPPSKMHSIDRIDNNGNYSKENCRWATKKQQANNRRTCVLFTLEGKTKNLKEWSEHFNTPYKSVWWRVKKGWNIEDALKTPIRTKK